MKAILLSPRNQANEAELRFLLPRRTWVVYKEKAPRLGDVLVCKVGTEQHEGDEHEEGADP